VSIWTIAAQRAALVRYVLSFPPPNIVVQGLIRAREGEERATWLEVESWVNRVGFRSSEADPLLRFLLDPEIEVPWDLSQNLILLMSWESLLYQNNFLSRLDRDKERLWSNLTWSFLEVIERINPGNREDCLGQKIQNDTQCQTRQYYDRLRRAPSSYCCEAPEESPFENLPSGLACLAEGEFRVDCSFAIKHLKRLAVSGHISKSDFQILLGCHLYGRSIEEMAVHLGVPYGVAKKRRQRAVKKLEKCAPDLSPSDPDSPLYQVERTTRREV